MDLKPNNYKSLLLLTLFLGACGPLGKSVPKSLLHGSGDSSSESRTLEAMQLSQAATLIELDSRFEFLTESSYNARVNNRQTSRISNTRKMEIADAIQLNELTEEGHMITLGELPFTELSEDSRFDVIFSVNLPVEELREMPETFLSLIDSDDPESKKLVLQLAPSEDVNQAQLQNIVSRTTKIILIQK